MVRPRRSPFRGALLVLGLFALGGIVLWGLFQAPRATSPPAPAAAEWSAPARPVRVASFNVLRLERGLDQVASEVRKLEPDYVLLQEVDSRDVVGLARALGMQEFHHPNAYERSGNLGGPKATWGNVIFAKYPLYDARPIPNPGGGSFGVWATSVVDGRKFVMANVHLSATWNANAGHVKESGENRAKEIANLLRTWRERGRPPMIVGGDFNQISFGDSYAAVTVDFDDALASAGKNDMSFQAGPLRTRTDYLLTSPQWQPVGGGAIATGRSDHPLIWVDVMAAQRPAVTRPATSEAR